MTTNVRRWFQRVRSELGFYQRVLRHPRTPRLARCLLSLAVIYLLSPVDLIPDWIPLLGQLDDLLLVPLLVVSAMMLIPMDLIEECRKAQASEDRTRTELS